MTPPESLTEEERHELLTVKALRGSATLDKLLRIHDRLQGEVEMLRVQQGRYAMAIERLEAEVREMRERPPMVHLDRVPSLEDRATLRDLLRPSETEAALRETIAALQAQVADLKQWYEEAKAMLRQARAEGFGVIRDEPKAEYVAPSLETFDLGPDLTPTRSPR